MPINDYVCKECNREFTDIRSNDIESGRHKIMETMCETPNGKSHVCPIERKLSTANFGDSVRMGMVKPPTHFRERVEQIKKANPGHRINS